MTELMSIWTAMLTSTLQNFTVFIHILLFVIGYTAPLLLLNIYRYTRWWPMVLMYIIWIWYDRRTTYRRRRKSNWLRRLRIYKYLQSYYPARLIKTTDLPPGHNYLLIMYPHGIVSCSSFPNFATEANNVESEIFPGLDISFVTININLYLPVLGEYLLALGACGASENNITNVFKGNSSKALLLIAGGGSEAAVSRPGNTYKILTSRRKGFVRIALKNGVALVPVFSFGENNTYDKFDFKYMSVFQHLIYRLTGLMPIILRGRIFPFSNMPRRTSINTVVGKPIFIPKVEKPSKEMIDKYHGIFFQELNSLFEEYKYKYDPAGKEAKLVML